MLEKVPVLSSKPANNPLSVWLFGFASNTMEWFKAAKTK
jgi:hypothetical protein